MYMFFLKFKQYLWVILYKMSDLRLISDIGPAWPPYSSGSMSFGTNSFNDSRVECTWIYTKNTKKITIIFIQKINRMKIVSSLTLLRIFSLRKGFTKLIMVSTRGETFITCTSFNLTGYASYKMTTKILLFVTVMIKIHFKKFEKTKKDNMLSIYYVVCIFLMVFLAFFIKTRSYSIYCI